MDEAIGETLPEEEKDYGDKNSAAVELGRLGGLKGRKARAKKLTSRMCKEIARNAAKARWRKKKGD